MELLRFKANPRQTPLCTSSVKYHGVGAVSTFDLVLGPSHRDGTSVALEAHRSSVTLTKFHYHCTNQAVFTLVTRGRPFDVGVKIQH